jgi:tRNA threonylcarbamoyladenosine biosynthesis protein TsaE
MKRGEIIYALDEIQDVAAFVYGLLNGTRIVALTGELGSGKTSLTQAVLRMAGVQDPIQSPTFTYLSCYTGSNNRSYYHFDLYRLNSLDSFITAGFVDYLNEPESYVFIEWPEIIRSLLTKNVCFIALDHVTENRRHLRYEIM